MFFILLQFARKIMNQLSTTNRGSTLKPNRNLAVISLGLGSITIDLLKQSTARICPSRFPCQDKVIFDFFMCPPMA